MKICYFTYGIRNSVTFCCLLELYMTDNNISYKAISLFVDEIHTSLSAVLINSTFLKCYEIEKYKQRVKKARKEIEKITIEKQKKEMLLTSKYATDLSIILFL